MINQTTLEVEVLKTKLKSKAVAIGLSFMIPGAGQMYAGSILYGILIMLAMIFFLVTSFYIFPLVASAALWVWAMMDANNKVAIYNEQLLREGFADIKQNSEAVENQGEVQEAASAESSAPEADRAGHDLPL